MSETRGEFRERIGQKYLDGYYGSGHRVWTKEDEMDGAEAVYAETLRDVIAFVDATSFESQIADWAAERGIDLEPPS